MSKLIAMQKPFSLFIANFFVFSLAAQNVFLTFSDPRFHELIPLRTDSMYITSGTQIREIGYDYDAWQRPLQIREKRNDPAQNSLLHIVSDYVYSPARMVFTTKTEHLSPFISESFFRIILDSIGDKISLLRTESLENAQWVSLQKDTFIYNAGGYLTERLGQYWLANSSQWVDQASLKYEYDGDKLLVERQISINPFTSDTSSYNEYIFTYDFMNRKTSRTWKNWNSGVIQNIFRERYAYDANDLLDTLKNDIWVAPLNDWYPDNMVVLDDSPEQQITQTGKEYRLNAQSQWYVTKETTYIPGPQIYTDQPSEELTKIFNLNINQFENNYRELTTYTDLPVGTIKGDYQQAYFENNNWNTDYHVEAWQIKIGSVRTEEPENAAIPPCGLPNPLTVSDVITLPEIVTAGGNARVEIYTPDGRLAFSQTRLDITSFTSAPAPPGIYLVVVRNEKGILCTQKVFASH